MICPASREWTDNRPAMLPAGQLSIIIKKEEGSIIYSLQSRFPYQPLRQGQWTSRQSGPFFIIKKGWGALITWKTGCQFDFLVDIDFVEMYFRMGFCHALHNGVSILHGPHHVAKEVNHYQILTSVYCLIKFTFR